MAFILPSPPHQDQIPPQTHERERHTKPHAPALPPPILTSTFRPHELLRRVPSTTKPTSGSGSRAPPKPNAHNDTDSDSSDDEWEFMPLRVPAGISLRNFGIQVVRLSPFRLHQPIISQLTFAHSQSSRLYRISLYIRLRRMERTNRLMRGGGRGGLRGRRRG